MYVTVCRLTLHDSVYYATREIGNLYETGRYLHNYALSYALFNDTLIRRPYFCALYSPEYEADLAQLNRENIYVTPARPLQASYLLATWKLAQDRSTLQAIQFGSKDKVSGLQSGNYPMNIGRAKELAPESEFEFFVISKQPVTLPRWIRMGKWASKVLVEASLPVEIKEHKGSFTSASPLNPLDVPGQLGAFDLISMPPVSLVVNARIEGAYYELPDGAKIPAGMKYTFPNKKGPV